MSRLSGNLIDTFKIIGNDEELLRLLYYPSDPLNPSKTNVKDLSDFTSIRKLRIIRAPKTDDIVSSTDKICRICMYFGNRSSVNRKVAEQDIVFDIYTHIDTYEINESRSLKIVDKISDLLNDKTITGIGKVKSDRMYIIGNPPNGYIGYKVVYTIGSGN